MRRVLIVGTGSKARRYIDEVSNEDSWGIFIVGFLSQTVSSSKDKLFEEKILGKATNLKEILHNNQIDEVIFANDSDTISEVKNLMDICEEEGTHFKLISPFFAKMKSDIEVTSIKSIPIISFKRNAYSQEKLLIKRVVDIIVSALLIAILFPIFLLISILVKLTSKGPIFYAWKVVGYNKKNFTGYKFRTMVINADEIKKTLLGTNEMSGPVFKMKKDPRITKVGSFLRKYSLDELPQIWSVLKGDMSLVGPRPPLQSEVKEYEHWHRRKLSFKPGITCLWQISGRNEISDFDEWVKLDLEYIDNWSLWLDLKILFKTIPVVLFGKGAR